MSDSGRSAAVVVEDWPARRQGELRPIARCPARLLNSKIILEQNDEFFALDLTVGNLALITGVCHY